MNASSEVILLANNTSCKWQNVENNLEIEMPDYDPNLALENTYAYVLKIKK